MDFSGYSDAPVQMAVDLVNTRNPVSGEERLNGDEDVRALLEPFEDGWAHPDWEIREADVHELRALRARFREVFWAEDPAQAATILNDILSDVSAIPRVSVHHGDPHLHFDALNATPVRWLGSIAAMGLAVVLVDEGLERFGVCASATCDDVFVDSSRNRSRRHCSDTCNTRENVAAYRRRRAQSAAD